MIADERNAAGVCGVLLLACADGSNVCEFGAGGTIFGESTAQKKLPQSSQFHLAPADCTQIASDQAQCRAGFVQAGESFNRTLGGRLSYAGPGSTVAGGGFAGPAGNRAALSTISNLPAAGSTTGGMTLSLFNAAATKVLTLELNASELDGTTKNIASPRVVTGDKTPATIESGVQVPYQQGGGLGVAATVAFKDAVLGLTVTPQITPDDRVGMKLSVHNDTVGNIYSGVPSINTNKVDTQVLVDNGGTVVIGGVYTQDTTDSKEQIPLLGDIPIIGWLFKTDTLVKSKKELLVFITPKILKDNMDMK